MRIRNTARAARRGFTLVEIILVVVIIATLAAVIGPRLAGRAKSARIQTTKIQMSAIKGALQEFEIHAGRYPTGSEGLKALVEKPSELDEDQWPDAYLEEVPKDGFGQPFEYKYPSEHGKDYDLISGGPDREIGTEDDITNYDQDGED